MDAEVAVKKHANSLTLGELKCRRFEGKTVIITGGGGAIGYAVAERLAAEGGNVVLTDVMPNDALQAKGKQLEEATGAQGRVLCVQGDCTDVAAVQNVIAKTVEKFGRLDGLFNNAGYQGAFKPTHLYPDADFPRVLNINVTGVFHFLKYSALQMEK